MYHQRGFVDGLTLREDRTGQYHVLSFTACLSGTCPTGKTYPSAVMTNPSVKTWGGRSTLPVRGVTKKWVSQRGMNCLCVLLPLENLLWAKLRDYAISRVNTCSRAIGTWSPRSSAYRPFACQASTSRPPEPTPITVYRAVPQVPPPLCS